MLQLLAQLLFPVEGFVCTPPHHSEMSALSLAASPSLSFILTLTAPSLPEMTKTASVFFKPSLVGSSFAMHAPLVLPAVTLGCVMVSLDF